MRREELIDLSAFQTVAEEESFTRRRRAGRNRRGNSASTSRPSEAAPIRTRFGKRRHGVRPNDSQVSKPD